MASVRFIECSTVAELITGPMRDEVAIIDVRDEVRTLSRPQLCARNSTVKTAADVPVPVWACCHSFAIIRACICCTLLSMMFISTAHTCLMCVYSTGSKLQLWVILDQCVQLIMLRNA